MTYGAVYLVTNLVNGKRYVGQTTLPVKARWAAHVRSRFTERCRLLSRAIQKYGASSFQVREVSACGTREGLNAAEVLAIETFGTLAPSGYNLTTGGESAYRRSDDTRRLLASAWSPERRREWSQKYGKDSSERLRMARSLGREARKIPIAAIASDGTRTAFGSCQEACVALGLEASAVSMCLSGKRRRRRHRGYRFERLTKR